MSRSIRIFKRIQKSLPQLLLCKGMLVVPPTEHIVRGFLLETTTEKDHVYLWRVVTPLLRPIRHPILDYSTRIPNGQKIHIPRDALPAAADVIAELIADGHIQAIEAIRKPHDFLRHVAWMESNDSIRFQTDLALMRCVAGYTDRAVNMFRDLDERIDRLPPSYQEYIGPIIKTLRRQSDTDVAGLPSLIATWEEENVERLGLRGSRDLVS